MSTTDKTFGQRALRRQEHIATAAYYNAERRGFAPGGELDDWLEAERRLDSGSAGAGVDSEASQRRSPEQSVPLLQEGAGGDTVIGPEEVHAWAGRLGVDAGTLRTAINKVGDRLSDVQGHLSGNEKAQRTDMPRSR